MTPFDDPKRPDRSRPGCTEMVWQGAGAQGRLFGILTRPKQATNMQALVIADIGETRTGTRRLLVSLARSMASHGIGSLRFDVAGQGDSPGNLLPPERWSGDIVAAAESLLGGEAAGKRKFWIVGHGTGAYASASALDELRRRGYEPDGLLLILPRTPAPSGSGDPGAPPRPAEPPSPWWRRAIGGLARLVSRRPAPPGKGLGPLSPHERETLRAFPALETYAGKVLAVLAVDESTAVQPAPPGRRRARHGTVLRVPPPLAAQASAETIAGFLAGQI